MTDAVLGFLAGDALVGIVAFQAVVLLVVLSNAVLLARPGRDRAGAPTPLVSLLVPARNEEANVGGCVRSLLAQTYPHLEVVVLDDRSEDGTRAILERERAAATAAGDDRLVVRSGEEPPAGWTGKNWACHQLALAARGEVLLFADADTVFVDPDAVGGIVRALQASRADLLSGLPRQLLGTPGEALLVPMVYWALLSFTPLALARVWRRAPIARAVGQLMAFRRDAYEAIGGHAAVRGSVVDDIDLARSVASARLAWHLLDATSIVTCRMYRSGREAAAGFARNLFAAFGSAILPFAFVWGWLAYAVLGPVAVGALHLAWPARVPVEPGWLLATIALSVAHWALVYGRLRLPIWIALLYPVTFAAFLAVAIRSFLDGVRRQTTWKGRALERPPTRWI
ncbi:MAG: glycosyltransferase family 2 protein [Trueperaceae bacterium]|nr:glycosyltransferase family 2 protein [Trueperaceae bacterium]